MIQLHPLKLHTIFNISSFLHYCSLKNRDTRWNLPCSILSTEIPLKSLGSNEPPKAWQQFVSICSSSEAWRLLYACQKRLYGGTDTRSKVSKSYIDLKWLYLTYQTANTSVFPEIEPFSNRGLWCLFKLQDRMTKLKSNTRYSQFQGQSLALGNTLWHRGEKQNAKEQNGKITSGAMISILLNERKTLRWIITPALLNHYI